MVNLFSYLRQIRASNIIFAVAIPVIIYIFVTSRNYTPALKAILGIEENAIALLIGFLSLAFVGVLSFLGAICLLKSIGLDKKEPDIKRLRKKSGWLFLISFLVGLSLHLSSVLDYYAISVYANSADPRSTEWIKIVDQSFTLTPEFQILLLKKVKLFIDSINFLGFFLLLFSFFSNKQHATKLGKSIIYLTLIITGIFSFYILMIAHSGFAVGLMVTIRAAFLAYFGASALGLIWAMLTKLSPSKKASILHTAIGLTLIAIGTIFFFQKQEEVALIGDYSGKIGVVPGTPQWVADTVRYGDFLPVKPTNPFKIRSLRNLEQGKSLLKKQSISGLLVPISEIDEYEVIWATKYLPTKQKNIGIASSTVGALLLLLVGIGLISYLHPLHVFSDFFVDTIRGIPMIVIILYIGLPLAGALKNASGGYMNIEMMTRGIIAISIGYSAYMAEIFRAGIEAIPKGQIEAARTLGLREHHVARFVIIPQAIAIVLPALGNEFIAMLKDTSLLSILSIRDVTQRMKEFQAQSFLAFEPFNTAALLYVFLTLLAASGIKSLDNIVNKNRIAQK